jgi:hypothetical protein
MLTVRRESASRKARASAPRRVEKWRADAAPVSYCRDAASPYSLHTALLVMRSSRDGRRGLFCALLLTIPNCCWLSPTPTCEAIMMDNRPPTDTGFQVRARRAEGRPEARRAPVV